MPAGSVLNALLRRGGRCALCIRQAGLQRRNVSCHALNATSSRSHCLFTLRIVRECPSQARGPPAASCGHGHQAGPGTGDWLPCAASVVAPFTPLHPRLDLSLPC